MAQIHWPQSWHDQAWSIRPLTLNQVSSPTKRTGPQLGHFGRLRSSVATTRVDRAWHADWTIIVDPPRRFFPHRTRLDPTLGANTWIGHLDLDLTGRHAARAVWRARDGFMKLSWLWISGGCGG